MQTLTEPRAMQAWALAERAVGRRVALVPTMGALHEGHLALVAEARRRAERVVVSIFVNPIQFNRRDDFEKYPRDLATDSALCEAAGVDAIYAPHPAAMYPEGFQTGVEVGRLAEPLCGANRPGHFRGVTTVVTKLFHAVQPDVAVFGEKDFQQLAIVRRMTADLDFG
ncbi:MAG TPA: pantoate--beta-alanine ligase, partial [Candidatus Limnocylindria bacterium]|nr:pantoate--beta-alanine ligase [Candidatus Limnocylindria bacterium]